jgi:hypothetical protein
MKKKPEQPRRNSWGPNWKKIKSLNHNGAREKLEDLWWNFAKWTLLWIVICVRMNINSITVKDWPILGFFLMLIICTNIWWEFLYSCELQAIHFFEDWAVNSYFCWRLPIFHEMVSFSFNYSSFVSFFLDDPLTVI